MNRFDKFAYGLIAFAILYFTFHVGMAVGRSSNPVCMEDEIALWLDVDHSYCVHHDWVEIRYRPIPRWSGG